MTLTEIALTAVLWINLGLFICNKADWFKIYKGGRPDVGACILVVVLSPLIFIFDFINRVFVQKWH